ncbi:chaperone modulator CbpM [Parafrankia discariae]|uniref:chaperone modulator CbpM n=1 Tax=Parafrankia discariae TaxID=365528 RepID=UPI00035EDB68|nr:chaperone modulator CbpM [Parafrankia discariae]
MTRTLVRIRPRDRELDLESFCVAAQLHPDLVRRLATLGLLDVGTGPGGRRVLAAGALARAGRIERLRRDLGITYTATGVVLDLLDRIDELERLLRQPRRGR